MFKTSDEHGRIQLRVPQSAKEITAKVMPNSEVGHFHSVEDLDHHQHSIGLIPMNDLPTRFRFRLISSPVSTICNSLQRKIGILEEIFKMKHILYFEKSKFQ